MEWIVTFLNSLSGTGMREDLPLLYLIFMLLTRGNESLESILCAFVDQE